MELKEVQHGKPVEQDTGIGQEHAEHHIQACQEDAQEE
jgi:hypothetical protein